MSRFGAEYRIARPTGLCSATQQPLEPGAACIATLCEQEGTDGFERRDFSPAAWERGARPEGLFSFWKTIVPPPDAKPHLLVDDSVLMDIFERLGSDERPQRQAFRFVLALILMRKKLLKFAGRVAASSASGHAQSGQSGEKERWLLQPRSPEGGFETQRPPIEVVNPNLSDEDVRELIDQLSEILQAEL